MIQKVDIRTQARAIGAALNPDGDRSAPAAMDFGTGRFVFDISRQHLSRQPFAFNQTSASAGGATTSQYLAAPNVGNVGPGAGGSDIADAISTTPGIVTADRKLYFQEVCINGLTTLLDSAALVAANAKVFFQLSAYNAGGSYESIGLAYEAAATNKRYFIAVFRDFYVRPNWTLKADLIIDGAVWGAGAQMYVSGGGLILHPGDRL